MIAKNNPSDTADREISTTRDFNAPRELVWRAMTDPLHVVNWWGPRGFTTTIEEMDVRPGGAWKLVMQGPDGTQYPNKSVFTEVVKPERLVFRHGGAKKGGPAATFEATWRFEEIGPGKTRVTVRMVFPTAAARDKVAKEYGAVEGLEQTLDRLAEQLATAGGESDFIIARTFTAPRALVWKAWTDPEHFAQWWGPRSFTNIIAEMKVRLGGSCRITMRSPEGVDYPMKLVYLEIAEPSRLVCLMDVSEHPPEWHEMVRRNLPDGAGGVAGRMVMTATFEELGKETKLTVQVRFDSAAIRDALVKIGMNEGWTESLARLAELVAKGRVAT